MFVPKPSPFRWGLGFSWAHVANDFSQLLDRQERDDSQRVMEAIMLLGEQGVLDEPNHPNPEISPRQP